MILESVVELDDFTARACEPFDYKFDGRTVFAVPEFNPPAEFSLGLIVGPSGSGKSSLLRAKFGGASSAQWVPNKAVVSQVGETPEDAVARLSAVGLNSVPSWCKPRHALSNGEGFRADLAQVLKDGAVIDEFTSVVDRNVAKAASVGLRRFVDRYNLKRVVVASCHYDIIEWLQPDWVFDTSTGVVTPRGSLPPRPKIELEIIPCDRQVWPIFAPHHYLSASLSTTSHCWLVWWNESLVGFTSTISFPHAKFANGRREHRTVILPEYQGLGIGVRVSDAIAAYNVSVLGKKYYSKTSHPRMAEYRARHPNWRLVSSGRISLRGTVVDGKVVSDSSTLTPWVCDTRRFCWSHEWIST